MKRTVKISLLWFVSFVLFLQTGLVGLIKTVALEESDSQLFQEMLDRAEAMVNYEWVPNKKIDVWNENPYNGKMYFEEGETVIGMPYTLFSWEFGFDSLLSFAQFKAKEKDNYSTTAYCSSMGADRTGPVYGSCCATFVSEVLGGSFMSEGNPRYDNVTGIQNSPHGTTFRNVKINDLKPGDALSNTVASHIVWVGANDTDTLTIYEQTPPVARKVVINKSSASDANGYFIYGGKTYNIVTKSNELLGTLDDSFAVSDKYPLPINAYTISTAKTVVYNAIEGSAKANKIYHTDLCRITKIYENGWCYVYFPLDAGGSDSGYVRVGEFFDFNKDLRLAHSLSQIAVFSRSNLSDQIGYIGNDDDLYIITETGNAVQVLYPLSNDEYEVGWISENQVSNLSVVTIHGDINSDGIVNNKDLTRLMKYLSGETVTVNTDVLDVNNDGSVNTKDLTRLMKELADLPDNDPPVLEEDTRYPVPFTCRTLSTEKVVCYNDLDYSSSPGKIYPEDDCTITAVYENGKVQCLCPWSDGTIKTVYVDLSTFIPFSSPSLTQMTAPKYCLTYLRAGDTSTSWGWIDEGDTIYKIGEIDNMTQVIYPKGDGGLRCAWVYSSDLL